MEFKVEKYYNKDNEFFVKLDGEEGYHKLINGKVLETQRLILREFKDCDLTDFYEYASVDGVGEMAGWNHHENIETTKEKLDSFITENTVFAIVYKKTTK